jgi:hypothetical protein
MFTFLRSIGLNPMEWADMAARVKDGAPFIGEILDRGLGDAQAVVVLLTGDDVARLGTCYEDEAPAPQARPNVLFEAGLALGLFPQRTVFVQVGPTRAFSDIAGRHLIEMNDSVAARQLLATRLKSAGCAVDLDGKVDWHTEGRFEAAVRSPDKPVPFLFRRWTQAIALALGAAILGAIAGTRLPKQEVIVTGVITRRTPSAVAPWVGVIQPGGLIPTDAEGHFSLRIPKGQSGSYFGVGWDPTNKARPIIESIEVQHNQGSWKETLENLDQN